MGQLVEVKVPDIGDFKDVEVIEVLVKPGDTVAKEQSLVTVESDKASMEIPSSAAGVVKELKVKLGDKVAEGTLLLVLDAEAGAAAAPAPAPATKAAPAAAPAPAPKPAAAPAAAPSPAPAASGGDVVVSVPDIGDFKDVEVIEILVKPGDTVAKEQSLITVESDKASMEIPSAAAGVIKELKVKLGDKVSKGVPVAVVGGGGAPASAPAPSAVAAPSPALHRRPRRPRCRPPRRSRTRSTPRWERGLRPRMRRRRAGARTLRRRCASSRANSVSTWRTSRAVGRRAASRPTTFASTSSR